MWNKTTAQFVEFVKGVRQAGSKYNIICGIK